MAVWIFFFSADPTAQFPKNENSYWKCISRHICSLICASNQIVKGSKMWGKISRKPPFMPPQVGDNIEITQNKQRNHTMKIFQYHLTFRAFFPDSSDYLVTRSLFMRFIFTFMRFVLSFYLYMYRDDFLYPFICTVV